MNNGDKEYSNKCNSTKKKVVDMKKIISILFFVLLSKMIFSQEISLDYKKHSKIYNTVFSEIFNTDFSHSFHRTFTINGNMLTYIDEFLAEKSTAPSLKKYITENYWMFLKEIDTAGKLRWHQQIRTKKIALALNKKIKISSHTSTFYSLSPIVFSGDKKRAFIISQKNSDKEVFEIVVYFFEIENDNWKLVKTIVPYFI